MLQSGTTFVTPTRLLVRRGDLVAIFSHKMTHPRSAIAAKILKHRPKLGVKMEASSNRLP